MDFCSIQVVQEPICILRYLFLHPKASSMQDEAYYAAYYDKQCLEWDFLTYWTHPDLINLEQFNYITFHQPSSAGLTIEKAWVCSPGEKF